MSDEGSCTEKPGDASNRVATGWEGLGMERGGAATSGKGGDCMEFKLDPSMGGTPDEDIIEICKELTRKGYTTKSSCEGHLVNPILYRVDDHIECRNDLPMFYIDSDGYLCNHNSLMGYISFTDEYSPFFFQSLPSHWEQRHVHDDDGNPYLVYHGIMTRYNIRLRKATDEEHELLKTLDTELLYSNQIHDIEFILQKLISYKWKYLNELRWWVYSLPQRII